jgi:pimeloyl-ACP methyl ester carboxylesterase
MVLLVLGLIAAFLVAALPSAASAAPPAQRIHWSPCDGGAFECATLPVPLDYDAPQGKRILLSLIRLPATEPAQRIGALLMNPGGPGGSGVDLVPAIAADLPPKLRARFDVVGFDPRGIARSTQLRCFGTPRQWDPAFWDELPLTLAGVAVVAAADGYLADACDHVAARSSTT